MYIWETYINRSTYANIRLMCYYSLVELVDVSKWIGRCVLARSTSTITGWSVCFWHKCYQVNVLNQQVNELLFIGWIGRYIRMNWLMCYYSYCFRSIWFMLGSIYWNVLTIWHLSLGWCIFLQIKNWSTYHSKFVHLTCSGRYVFV